MQRTDEERTAILGAAVRAEVARGGTVQSQTGHDAVIAFGKPINHTLHLIITLCTCVVFWGPVWLLMTLFGGRRRVMVSVDEFGQVRRSKLGKG